MTKELQLKLENDLTNFLAFSFSKFSTNGGIKDIFMILNTIPVKFVFVDTVDTEEDRESVDGAYGGVAKYNSLMREYFIEIILYNNSNNRSWEECIEYILNSVIKSMTYSKLAFTYLHELKHIFNRHLINYRYYSSIAQNMLSVKSNEHNLSVGEILNIAMDYHINSDIKNSELFKNIFSKNKNIDFLISDKYNAENMSEIDILKDIIENSKMQKYGFNNGKGNAISLTIEDEDGYKQEIIISIDIEENKDIEADPEQLEEVLNSSITRLKSSGINSDILKELGLPIEVTVSWLDKLNVHLNNISYNYINKRKRNWSKPNMFFRTVNMPGSKRLKSTLNAFVVIDYSGSMQDNDLQKINYVLKKMNERGFTINVLGHAMELELIETIKPNAKDLNEFIKYRKITGGTSHVEVFEHLEKEINKQSLVMMFSDFCSDIEDIWDDFNWQKQADIVFINTAINSHRNIEKFSNKNKITYINI